MMPAKLGRTKNCMMIKVVGCTKTSEEDDDALFDKGVELDIMIPRARLELLVPLFLLSVFSLILILTILDPLNLR